MHSVLVKLVIRRKQIKILFVHKIALPLYMYMYLFGHMPDSSACAHEGERESFLGVGTLDSKIPVTC